MRLLIAILALAGFAAVMLIRYKQNDVPLPAPSADKVKPAISTLTVTISGQGKFEVEGQSLDLRQLEALISTRTWNEHSALVFKTTDQITFNDGLAALDLARKYGISRIALDQPSKSRTTR